MGCRGFVGGGMRLVFFSLSLFFSLFWGEREMGSIQSKSDFLM